MFSALIADLTPRIEDDKSLLGIEGLVQACQIAKTPRAIVEAGIVGLLIAHKSMLAATGEERVRSAILPSVHGNFLSEFLPTASQAGIDETGLLQLVARRLATYDSLMDKSLPEWQYRLSEEIYEKITGNRCNTPSSAAVGMVFLSMLNATAAFVKDVLK